MALLDSRGLAQLVYEKIKLMMGEAVFSPGERINKRQLEDLLGVSQTPINDALHRLLGEQYLERDGSRGFRVRRFTCREFSELFAVRAGTEALAAWLACQNASDQDLDALRDYFSDFNPPLNDAEYQRYVHEDLEFHTQVIRLSRNDLLLELNERYGYMLKSNQRGLVREPTETLPEHRAIIDAISARSADLARALMQEHHLTSRTAVLRSCTDSEDGGVVFG